MNKVVNSKHMNTDPKRKEGTTFLHSQLSILEGASVDGTSYFARARASHAPRNLPSLPRKTRGPHKSRLYSQGVVGEQGPQSQFIAKLPQDCKTALNYKTLYDEKQTSTEINGIRRRRIPNPKPLNHFVKKREHTPPPSEISCGADNSGAKVRKNWLPKARLSQSRSLGFLVWCGRTRLSFARASRSKARLVSKSSQKPINKLTKLAIK